MKRIFGAMIFLPVVAVLMFNLNGITMNKNSEGCIQLSDFYDLEENQVDVLCIGSSHVYYGINTCLLYDDYGIASYLLASPGQPVWISYYLLEEALKTQQPKLVVLDTGTLFRKEEDFEPSSWEVLIHMKPSLTKWNVLKLVNSYDPLLDVASAFFAFPFYHTRSFSLTSDDYKNTDQIRYHGYKPRFGTISKNDLEKYENTKQKEADGDRPVTAYTEEYLLKFIRLCQDQEIPLVFANTPYTNQSQAKQKAAAYVSDIAHEYEIPLLEGNDLLEEMQIDFAHDLLDSAHLNYSGSSKFTDYLAKWLKDHYHLPDRRGDDQYLEWEEVSTLFRHVELNARMLKDAKTQEEYFDTLKEQEDSQVTVQWETDGGLSVYDGGACIFSGQADKDFYRHFDLGTSDLMVSCADGKMKVVLDLKEYAYVEEGMNILVYDKVAERVIDGVGFDAGSGKAVR